MSIRVHIERLVVDAGIAGDTTAFGAAVTAELTRAMGQQATAAGLLRDGGAVERLAGPVLTPCGSTHELATQVGAAIHASLAGTTPAAAGTMKSVSVLLRGGSQ